LSATGQRVLFLYTNSYDISADAIIGRLGNDTVFRFNLDLWDDYKVEADAKRFLITNPGGRSVRSDDVAKFLWRKPLTNQELYPDRTFPRERVFKEQEIAYAMREVWNSMYFTGRAVLIDPLSDVVAGKLIQAQLATKHFTVPNWAVISGTKFGGDDAPVVAKSLTAQRIKDRSVLYTTRVNPAELSPDAPWFLQSLVQATEDVTVVFVRSSIFAFAVDRGSFPADVIDWRRARILAGEQSWVRHQLPGDVQESIRQFMSDMCLHYGRLDFLLADGAYAFLEVNPNGEWGWLDQSGKEGVLDALASELSPETPCHPLPNPRVINAHGRLAW
jgi:hypothetical protein